MDLLLGLLITATVLASWVAVRLIGWSTVIVERDLNRIIWPLWHAARRADDTEPEVYDG